MFRLGKLLLREYEQPLAVVTSSRLQVAGEFALCFRTIWLSFLFLSNI